VDIVQVAAIAIARGMHVDDLAAVPLSFPTYEGILFNAAASIARQLGLPVVWRAHQVEGTWQGDSARPPSLRQAVHCQCRRPEIMHKLHVGARKRKLLDALRKQLVIKLPRRSASPCQQRCWWPPTRSSNKSAVRCGARVRKWPDPEAPTAGPAGPLTEATTLGLAERFGSLRLDHRKRHRSGREHQGWPLCSRSTIGS
jgi:hypothetical protein